MVPLIYLQKDIWLDALSNLLKMDDTLDLDLSWPKQIYLLNGPNSNTLLPGEINENSMEKEFLSITNQNMCTYL